MAVNGLEQRILQILNQGSYREIEMNRPYHLKSWVPTMWAHYMTSLKVKRVLKFYRIHPIIFL